jgi:outer membrane immunogenic protein
MYSADTTVVNLFTGGPLNPLDQIQGGRGWLGTATAGFDYQFNDHIVAGAFADYDFAKIKGTLQDSSKITVGDMTEQSAWAVGARLGWLVAPTTLAYVNGGYSQAHFPAVNMVANDTIIAPPPVGHSPGTPVSTVQSNTYQGWFVGSGVETMVAQGWFWRNEYRYANYREASVQDIPLSVTVGGTLMTIRPVVQTVRTELVYKFN